MTTENRLKYRVKRINIIKTKNILVHLNHSCTCSRRNSQSSTKTLSKQVASRTAKNVDQSQPFTLDSYARQDQNNNSNNNSYVKVTVNVDPSQLKSRDSYAQNNNNNKANYVKVVNADPRQQNTVDSYARNQNNNSKNVDLRPSNNRDSYAGNNNNNARKVGHTSYSDNQVIDKFLQKSLLTLLLN